MGSADLRTVRDYHERTKHRLDRYAASPGQLDWATQPDPFRAFAGAETIALPRPAPRETPTYDGVFAHPPAPAALDADLVGRLLRHSLALSAWKQAPGSRPWSLRVNPSSGALHPTEGYLIAGPVAGLVEAPGVFHYAPLHHRLERRCRLSPEQWEILGEGLPKPGLLIGLTSIHWREAWKYGERAFRYCHLDVGHALGALAVAARTLGWEARLLDGVPPGALDRLLGAHLQSGPEAEHGDGLVALFPAGAAGPEPLDWSARVPEIDFAGEPNSLSSDHRDWPVIGEVARATRGAQMAAGALPPPPDFPPRPDRDQPAEGVIRRRRSAVDMDGETALERDVFFRILGRLVPSRFPFAVLPGAPRISLAVFVHRVEGLDPGLYLLLRDPSHEADLRAVLDPDFAWETPAGCPPHLPLRRLLAGDLRQLARTICCHQDIAAAGAFSLGMLAAFDAALAEQGPPTYRRLYWECGLVGQILYLEAEAAGVRGTGIGCFFDDVMHELLGIHGHAWQSLYHFTVGGPVLDPRLRTLPAYAHLDGGT